MSKADTAAHRVTLYLTVTGAGLCGTVQAVDSTLILITPEPIAQTGFGATKTICANDSAIHLTSRRIANGTAVWSSTGSGQFKPDRYTATEYILSAADTAAHQIKLYLRVTGVVACGTLTAVDSTVITVPPAPIAKLNVSPVQLICANTRTVNISGSAINATGLWSTKGTGTFSPDTTVAANNYVLSDADTAARNVLLILSAKGTGSCSSYTDTAHLNILVTPEPIASLLMTTNDTSICANKFMVPILAKVANATGKWTTDGSGWFLPNDTIYSRLTATTYSLSIADTSARLVHLTINARGYGGCSNYTAHKTLTIRTSPPPSVSVGTSSVVPVCTNNPNVQLSGSVLGATGVVWTTNGTGAFSPGTTTGNAVYTLTNSDTAKSSVSFTLTSTGNGACNSVSKLFLLNLKKAPRPDFVDSSVCKGLATTFYDKSIVPAPPASSVVWKFGDGVISSVPLHTYTTDGIYIAKMIVTDNNNCVDSISKSVDVYPLPVADFTNNANCFRNAVYFTDKSTVNTLVTSNSITSWNWTFGDGGTSTAQNPSHVFPSANVYTSIATLLVKSNHNCSSALKSYTLNVTPAPIAKFTTDSVCLNQSTHFTDLSSPVLPTLAPLTYTLNYGDNTPSVNDLTITHKYPSSGSYPATLIVQSTVNGCSDTIIDTVMVHPLPQVSFAPSVFCVADSTHFLNTSTISTGTIKTISWDFGDGTSGSGAKVAHKYPILGTFGVILTAKSEYSCEASYSKNVTINPSPTAAFSVDKDIIELHKSVQFTNNSTTGQGATDLSSKWSFGDTTSATSTANSPSYLYNVKSGTFTTKLVVTNNFNCSDSTTKPIIVKLPPKVPNVFTPNGDGSNDVLYVLGGPYSKMEFRILNNWGEFIFSSTSQSLGWDGTKNGVRQPIGVYVFTLTATTEDGQQHTLYGDVTLMR